MNPDRTIEASRRVLDQLHMLWRTLSASQLFDASFVLIGLVAWSRVRGLSGFGRGIVAVLMFLGRVGPLTFAAALARTHARGEGLYHHAYEDVSIG